MWNQPSEIFSLQLRDLKQEHETKLEEKIEECETAVQKSKKENEQRIAGWLHNDLNHYTFIIVRSP